MEIALYLFGGLVVGIAVCWILVRARNVGSNPFAGDQQKLLTQLEVLKSENSKLTSALEIEKGNSRNLQESNGRLMTDLQVAKQADLLTGKQVEDSLKEIATLKESNYSFLKRGTELSNELAAARQKLENSDVNFQKAQTKITQLEKEDEFRRQENSNALSSLKQIQDKIQRDRDRELEERNRVEVEHVRRLKETWINHEETVKNRIKAICQQYTIEYVDQVPFKGKPDNTLKINNEYVIFDAKSPGGDDMSNFPAYIKAQVESGKYVKEDDVRKEVFLVVPNNTLDHLTQYSYQLPDYTVYIISLDSLEPVILTLRRIEDYEFADQLSPEERENICRVIGKFVHLSKRRIQIDGFFAKQFFELVYRSEMDLPKELMDKVAEFERSERLNPPTEKRSKQISVKQLEIDNEKLNSEANQKGILTQDSTLIKEINKLPLYSTESEKSKKDQGKLFEE